MTQTYKTYDKATAAMKCDGCYLSHPHMHGDPNSDADGRVWVIVYPKAMLI